LEDVGMSEENKVDRFEHDKTLMFMNHVNRRMFILVLAVCITFSLIIVFYTVREKNWLNAMERMQERYLTVEVQNGTQEVGDS
jgi:hypothetical protein